METNSKLPTVGRYKPLATFLICLSLLLLTVSYFLYASGSFKFLSSNEQAATFMFKLIASPDTRKYTIDGHVWIDSDKNGVRTSTEYNYPQARIVLTNPSADQIVAETTSNLFGRYSISSIPEGEYRLTLMVPTGYKASLDNSFIIKINGNKEKNFGIYSSANVNARSGYYDWVVNHIFATGQSLSVGADGCPALTTDSNTLSVTVTDENNNLQNSFSPWIENKRLPCVVNGKQIDTPVETIYSSMVRHISSQTDDVTRKQYSVGMHGGSGLPYTGIKKGTAVYEKGMAEMKKAQELAYKIPRPFRVAATTVVHGESDHIHGTTESQYRVYMHEWQDDYEKDAKQLTGQTDPVPLFMSQISSFTTYGQSTSVIPEAQLKAAEQKPNKIYLVGPKYFLEYRPEGGYTSAHLINTSYRQLGEYYGKVMKRVLVDGEDWKPLSPRRITASGNTIFLDLHVPNPPVVIDTKLVREANAYGFEVLDGSLRNVQITNVKITDEDTIAITIDRKVTSDMRLLYAHTGVAGSIPGKNQVGSARGNIRDSDTTWSAYGNKLYNWMVHFNRPVSF